MASKEGACACCGEGTRYDGRIPILCPTCREARTLIAVDGAAQLLSGSNLNPRLFLPDSMLIPKPMTMSGFR